MNNKQLTLGILGGMGPYATLKFYEIMLNLTKATRDSEHLHIILDVNPHIPSRSRCYLFGERSPVTQMIDACCRLQSYPVDMIALPCNSACAFLEEVQPHVAINILNIIEITAQATAKKVKAQTRVSVLGGIITTEKQTYRPYLEARNLVYCPHSSDIQSQSEDIIYGVKSFNKTSKLKNAFKILLKKVMRETGAEAIILGCTEFACLLPIDFIIPIIDSTTELARYCVKICKK